MKIKMILYLTMVLFLMMINFSCEKQKIDNRLDDTSWELDKIELLNNGKVIFRVDFDTIAVEKINFSQKNNQVTYNLENGEVGCGEWEIKDGKLRAFIGVIQIIPDLCVNANFDKFITIDNKLEFINEKLVLNRYYSGSPQFMHLYFDTITEITTSETTLKNYFKPVTYNPPAIEFDCCGDLN